MKSLAPLPGGIADYLTTLIQILEWIDQADTPRFTEFAEWITTQYKISRTMVNVYAQVTVRLNVVQKATDNRLIISDFGRQILASDMETRSRLLGQFLMTEYVAARDVLAVYAHAPEPIHIDIVIQKLGTHFSEWTSATQFDERIHWLLSLQCLQRVSGRCYEITVLGRELSDQYPSDWFPTAVSEHQHSDFSLEPLPEIQITSSRPNSNEILNALTNELIRSSTGVVYQEFERALGAAFEYLGFTVIYLGEPGETDLLLTASIGSESYRVVIDAKTRQNGRLESLEVYTLQDHRRRHQANYAVVVAKNFSAGKVGRHAEDGGIVLLSVDVLIQWLNQFSRSPLNLADYRNMFITPGIVETLPTEIVRIADQHLKWSDLIVDLMELMQETYHHGLTQQLPCDHLFTMLATRLRGVRYSRQEVQNIMNLLTHPAFTCATGEAETGISLAMNRRTFAHTLRAIADRVDTNISSLQE